MKINGDCLLVVRSNKDTLPQCGRHKNFLNNFRDTVATIPTIQHQWKTMLLAWKSKLFAIVSGKIDFCVSFAGYAVWFYVTHDFWNQTLDPIYCFSSSNAGAGAGTYRYIVYYCLFLEIYIFLLLAIYHHSMKYLSRSSQYL